MNPPRSLPFSDDAEKGVLCSMIRSAEVRLECASRLSDPLFYAPAHRAIFLALGDLTDEGVPVDFLTLKNRLARDGQLEEIGGAEFLNELWDFVPTAENWGYYAALLSDYYCRRTTIRECEHLKERMYDLEASASQELSAGVETALTKLSLRVAKADKRFSEYVSETLEAIDQRARDEGKSVRQVDFGLPSLDSVIAGVQPGELCVICAETSHGKTALALQALLHVARPGFSAGLFSFEMPGTQIVERILAREGTLSMKSIRSGKFSEAELTKLHATASRIRDYAIFIEEDASHDISGIVSRCRYLKVRYNVQLIIVDYVQLVPTLVSRRDSTREREVAEISRRLKLAALELQVPVIALSQLNDAGKLRESRAIGQDADLVLRIDKSDSENAFAVDLVIAKHRSGPSGQSITVEFFGEYMCFEEAKK